MGYTHYWSAPRSHTPEEWEAFTTDVQKILGDSITHDIVQTLEDVEVTEDRVYFNGSYETFCFTRGFTTFTFCKTAHHPYDDIITAILLAAKHHLPAVDIRSDGSRTWGRDWFRGIGLFNRSCAPLIVDEIFMNQMFPRVD